MQCSQERSAKLMEYVEGSLPTAEAAELEMHLSGCASCREELESWRRLEAQLQDFPLVAEPANFTAAVMARVVVPRRARPVAYRPVDPMSALALGAVLIGLGTLLSGFADWQWQFDSSYWLDLALQLANPALDAATNAATQLLASFASAAYSSLTDSAPILMAALLLALFALGPSEIMSAVSRRREV